MSIRLSVCFFSCLATLATSLNTTVAADAARPNFLFILTDDQSPHSLGAYGNTECSTPNIDRIAKMGMLLHDAHHMGSWSGAVCRPSRTMIMTGRSVWRIPGAKPQAAGKSGRLQEQELTDFVAQRSMPAVFNAAGYDTFRTCKRGNTFPPASKLFDVLHEGDMREGNDEHGSAWHGDRAMDFLNEREQAQDPDPFLMFLGFSHPHDPRDGKPEYLDKYHAVNLQEPTAKLNPLAPSCQSTTCLNIPSITGTPDCATRPKCPVS
ncbi:MAG: sulfatase-like hydrolase/transferase [Pirellulaceae bacterium]